MKANMKENIINELELYEMQQAYGGILPIFVGVGTPATGGILILVMDDKKK